MAFNLDSVRQSGTIRPPRIVLLGTEKIGKSTFASGANNAIFIPIKGEEGIDELNIAQFPTCDKFEDVMECLETLGTQEHQYQTGVLDSESAFEYLLHDKLCRNHDEPTIEKVLGGYGKGYVEAVNLMRQVTDYIDQLRSVRNMAFILIGHVEVKTFKNPAGSDYEHYTFDVHQKLRNMLYRWADVILFANTKTSVKTKKEFGKEVGKGDDYTDGARFLYTQKRPAHPGGGRGVFGRLPYELPLSWAEFMKAVSAASTQ